MSLILTLNAGGSSVRFALPESAPEPAGLIDGQVENPGADARLVLGEAPRGTIEIGRADHLAALAAVLSAIEPVLAGRDVAGVGHRIV